MSLFRFLLIWISLSACFIEQKLSAVESDSFWLEGIAESPLKKEFNFKNKPRIEDSFGIVGYGFFRFFIVTVGTIPIAYLIGSQFYDWFVYFAKNLDLHWQPGFWGWENSRLTDYERSSRAWTVVGITIGTSLVIAVIDTLLYHLLYSSSNR